MTRLFGIRIGVDASWFLVLFVVIFFLNERFQDALDSSSTTAYLAAVLGALCLFGSIMLHELGHALEARRRGIEVTGIDLFFFGGLMKMNRDTDTPGAEFTVAAAGPLVTLLIALVGSVAGIALAGGTHEFWDAAVLGANADVSFFVAILSLTVTLNAGLLLFNLVPAFPLDGGRIARALFWKLTGDRAKATRWSATAGQFFGWALVGLGLYLVAAGGTVDGLWLGVLGYLLASSARAAIAQSDFVSKLAGITVADVMDAEPVVLPARVSAQNAYEDWFLRYQGWPWFAVVEDDGRFVGLAHRAAVQHAALSADGTLPVRAVVVTDNAAIRDDAPLETLLGSRPLRELGALMAVDGDGRLRGVVTVEMVSRAVAARL